MRKFYLSFIAFFSIALSAGSQTVLIDPAGEGGFELGTTFAANGWTVENGTQTNKWELGTAASGYSGSRAAYVSNDGGITNTFTITTPSIVHFYRDIVFPAGEGDIQLTFKVQGYGESTFDKLRVYVVPTTTTPAAGTDVASGQVGLTNYSYLGNGFVTTGISIPAVNAGTTKRIIFSWINDGSVGTMPAISVDDIKLTSQVITPLSGTYNINNTAATSGTNFNSFTDAILRLNNAGISGPVIFNVSAGQVFPELTPVITATGTAANTITFQKSGAGSNPVLRSAGGGNSTSADAAFTIAGGDYFTFDGIDVQLHDVTNPYLELGYYIRNNSATDGAQNNTIKNTAITLNRANTSSRGIYQHVNTTPTAATGANSGNKYYNLTIKNVYGGIYLLGNATIPDLNAEVGTTSCTSFNMIGDPATANDLGGSSSQAFGIRAANQSNVKIFNNNVSNVTATTTADGILVETFQGASEVYNNKVTGIRNSSTSSTSSASGIRMTHTTTGTHSLKVYNNFVSEITHGFTGTATASRYIKGINISGTGGATTQTYYIDFNSVRIDGSGSPNTSSTAFEIATTSGPVIIARNNIFANVTAAQGATSKHYAYVSTSATAIGPAGSLLQYNDLYVPNDLGVSGHTARGNTTNYNTVGDMQAGFTTPAGGAANNTSVNPDFVSATDLHTGAAGLNGSADPAGVAWVTNDIDCEVRNSPSDIGADEFTPLVLDMGATALVDPVSPKCYTALENVSVTIKNYAGVPIDFSVNPVTVTVNVTGAITQTLTTTLNSGTLAAGASMTVSVGSLNMSAAGTYTFNSLTTLGGDQNASNNAMTPVNRLSLTLGGTYTVGAGGNFSTLTQAAIAYNTASCVTGHIVFELIDATYSTAETFPIVFNFNAAVGTNKLNIRPATGVTATITGSSSSSIIKINGADYITIDGSNNGSTSRNLTVENTSTLTNTAVIWLASQSTGAGASNNTIKNTVIRGGSNTVSSVFGIYAAGTTISTSGFGDDNDALIINNNAISKAYYGIYVVASTTGVNNNLSVTDNQIGSSVASDYITFRGTQISYTTNSLVEKNRVFNLISSNTDMRAMEFGVGVTNTLVSKNIITEVNYTGTSFSAGKGMTFFSGAGANVTISNNMISALKGHGSSTETNNSWGIMLRDGSGYNVYYNSINIPDNRSTTASTDNHGGLYISSTVSAVDLRNNIISVTGAPGNAAGRMYAIYSLVTSPSSPFSVSNYNDLYVAGTNHSIGYYHTANRNTLADWRTATGQDLNSVSVLPVFISPTDLHLHIANNGTLNGAATPIGSVLVDIDEDIRNALNPDIGADEFTPPPGADVGISGLVSPATNVCYSATETVSVTLRNYSGSAIDFSIQPVTVNVTASGAGVYAGTTLVNSGTLASGGSMTVTMPTTFDMTANGTYTFDASTVIAGDINAANDAMPATTRTLARLGGTYTVGVGGDYTTLTAAVAAYNAANCISGAVVFSLIDATYPSETFPIQINQNAFAGTNTLTIRPAAGVNPTISGNATSIIRINGADNVIIDGSNNGTASRNLTLENTTTSSSRAVIYISSVGTGAGSVNTTIKNTNIRNGSNTATVYGIYAGGTSISTSGSGADNDNLTIQNNSISKAYYGIYAVGTSTGVNNNLQIIDNSIGSNNAADYLGYMGIQVGQATGANISGNTIFNIITGNSVNPTGMLFGTGFTNATIEKNIIRALTYTGTSGYGARGMDFNTGSATSNITVRNNMIANMGGDGWDVLTTDAIMGIRLTGTTGGVTLEHNTIHLSGNFAGHVDGILSAGLFVNASVTDLSIRNNIFSNRLDNTNVTNDTAYAIYSLAPTAAFTVIDYNDYYVDGPAAMLGKIDGVDRPTLIDIQAGFGGNAGSVNIQPLFASASDAHLVPGLNFALDNLGTPIAGVTTDIDGETRSVATPDMGADEFTSPVCTGAVGGTASAATSTFCNSGSTTVSATGYSSGAISTYQWQSSTDNTIWSDLVGEDNPLELVTGTLNDTTYYRLRVTCNSGAATAFSNVVTVTVNPNPVVSVAPTAPAICPGSSVVLTASGNSNTYTWSPATGLSATTGPSVTANPATTTVYTVTGTITASGCTSTATVQVTVHPSITATATALPATICNGQSSQLNATAIQNVNPIRITELTAFRTGTGATNPYPAAYPGGDLLEISNLSNQPYDMSGMVIELWSAAAINRTWTAPAGTIVPAQDILILNFGTGTDNSTTRYYNTGGATDFIQSSSLVGVVVKQGSTVIDALAVNSYVWPAASGVTATDWSGNIASSSGRAGVSRTAPTDTNSAGDWEISNTPSPLQTIGTYNGGFTLPNSSYTYVWTPATGLSSATIANPMASPTTTTTYTVTATETITGCTGTANVTVIVNQLPAITTQPASQTVCPGSNVTFTVAATGTGLTYQWQKDGVDLAGETTNSLTINNVTAANTGSYTVVVSGTCAPAATSNAAVLALTPVPAITTQPVAQTACEGSSATFSVTATGDGLTYQWRKEGINIAGATSATYTISPVAVGDAANYDVVVSGTCAPAVTSVAVSLTVDTKPAVTAHPSDVTTCEGNPASFTISATGTGITYQWRINGTNISGATSATYNIAAVSVANAGSYDVVVSGTCTPPAVSNAATLTVQTAPAITTQPQSQTICAGQNVTFTVAATGAGLTYQWQKNSVDIAGANSASYTITGATSADAANYTVQISGTCTPPVTSNIAALTVDQAPVIGTQPVSQTVCSGSNVTFSVAATGVGLTYQWYRNGTIAIAGATSNSYTITGATAANAGQYHVVVNSSCGTTVTSSTATLTVNTPPAITVQPSSQTACLNSNVTFNVTATGSGLTYQWKKNGTDIAGATSSSLTISNVSAADLGTYTVVVTGVCGSPVTSNAATLAVSSTNTWLGTANSDWNNEANWCAGIPTSTSVILIPQGTPFNAVLLGNGAVRDLTIQTGATLTIGAGGNLSIYGNVVNSGTITASAGTVTFAGTTPQSIPALTVGNVVMNGTGGVTLGGTLTIVNSLTLTNGNITLGTNNLILPGGSMGSVSSHIITNGTGVVTSNNINVPSVIFPVGPDAASYNPVMIANGGGRNYSVRVSTGITPTIFNAARAINRTWNVTVNTAPAAAASITFGYADAHANASSVPTANMEVGRHTGTTWQVITPAGGVAPFGVPALRTVTTQSVAFGPMVVSNVGGILDPTSLPNIDTDITSAVLMPNAFESSTILRLNVLRTMKINWTIRDAQGKVVMTFSRNVSAGVNDIPLMLRHLAGGTYYMLGETDKGRTGVLRFIRL